MSDISLASVTEGVRAAVGNDCGLGSRVKFDLKDDGVIWVDATTVPNVVSNENNDADCTLVMTIQDFVEMNEGRLNSTTAFMMGKLKIVGDMSIAMKLDSVLK
jgi:putative sterol carrier protein